MLFIDLLDQIKNSLTPEFEKLKNELFNKQSHQGDLLLLQQHGFYDETNDKYCIGLGKEGMSYNTHYDFIHQYRDNSIKDSYSLYLKIQNGEEIINSEGKIVQLSKQQIDDLITEQAYIIQFQMLIYLKIWETNLFKKQLHQISRILKGEPYNWLIQSNYSLKMHHLIDKLSEIIKVDYPNIWNSFDIAFNSQIRNAIAHSDYSILERGKNIQLHNHNDNIHSQLTSISFDQWNTMFHHTMMIYNFMIRLINDIEKIYKEKNVTFHEILITKTNEQKIEYMSYDTNRERWITH